jgi:hypothetical protein
MIFVVVVVVVVVKNKKKRWMNIHRLDSAKGTILKQLMVS